MMRYKSLIRAARQSSRNSVAIQKEKLEYAIDKGLMDEAEEAAAKLEELLKIADFKRNGSLTEDVKSFRRKRIEDSDKDFPLPAGYRRDPVTLALIDERLEGREPPFMVLGRTEDLK